MHMNFHSRCGRLVRFSRMKWIYAATYGFLLVHRSTTKTPLLLGMVEKVGSEIACSAC